MHRYAWACASVISCLVLLACSTPPPPPPVPEVWPTNGWPISTPEAQGIDSAVLASAVATLTAGNVPIHSLLIERNGYVVLDAYFFPFSQGEPHDVASITKSVTSTLVGIAQNANVPIDTAAPIDRLLPAESISDPRKSQITLGNLLSMTSGLDCSENQGRSLLAQMESSPHWASYVLARPLAADPGSRFNYCAGNMHLVSAALTRATGLSAFEFARTTLFAHLGITNAIWPSDPDGVSHGFADLRLEPRDLAKLGYLWLHDGRWEDKQLISPAYMKAALAPQAAVEPGIEYGYGLWLYPGHAPFDFEANGRGGQRITVIPALNAVIVVTGGGMDANLVAPLIASAFVSSTALPLNDAGDQRLATAIADAGTRPAPSAAPPPPGAIASVDGKVFYLPSNPLGVQSLSLTFSSALEASVHFGFADGTGEDHPIGLDGAPRLSINTNSGLSVAVAGHWLDDSFALDYDEIARINAYRFVLTPAAAGLSIHLTERSGLVNMTMIAGTSPPDQVIAGITGGHG